MPPLTHQVVLGDCASDVCTLDLPNALWQPTPSAPGVSLFADAPERAHLVQFYNSDQFLYDTVTRFLGAGLASGEGVIVVATGPHLDGLQMRLLRNSFDVDRARKTGQLIWLDADETLSRFMHHGRPDPARFVATMAPVIEQAARARNGVVRAYGEMVDVLCGRGNHGAAIRLEHYWNLLIAARPLALLCGYSARHFSDSQQAQRFRSVCESHSCVMPTESFSGLLTENDQQRQATLIEQHARALEIEVEHRKSLEQALRQRNAEQLLASRKLEALAQRLEARQSTHAQLAEDLLEVSLIISRRAP